MTPCESKSCISPLLIWLIGKVLQFTKKENQTHRTMRLLHFMNGRGSLWRWSNNIIQCLENSLSSGDSLELNRRKVNYLNDISYLLDSILGSTVYRFSVWFIIYNSKSYSLCSICVLKMLAPEFYLIKRRQVLGVFLFLCMSFKIAT